MYGAFTKAWDIDKHFKLFSYTCSICYLKIDDMLFKFVFQSTRSCPGSPEGNAKTPRCSISFYKMAWYLQHNFSTSSCIL